MSDTVAGSISNFFIWCARVSALVIGTNCFVNAVYFSSLYNVYAPLAYLSAFAGFVLNTILYNNPKPLDDLYNRMKEIFVNRRAPDFKDGIAEILSIFNGIVIFIFTYNSWQGLMSIPFFSFIPVWMPLIFSLCFGVGTYALLFDDVKDNINDLVQYCNQNTGLNLSSLFSKDLLPKLIGTAGALLLTLTGYYPIVVKSFQLGCTWSPYWLGFHALYAISIVYSEIVFNVQKVKQFINGISLKNPLNSHWSVTLLAALNSIGNGFITVGESTLSPSRTAFVVGLGSFLSFAVMIRTANNYNSSGTLKNSQISEAFDNFRGGVIEVGNMVGTTVQSIRRT